jgi:hypothetical protein
MTTKYVTLLEDDTDGSQASETVNFGLDGAAYEIDLSDKNASALRDTLTVWISHARKTGGRSRSASGKAPFAEVDTKAVRAWAQANHIKINSRGRIPADIIAQYRSAGN